MKLKMTLAVALILNFSFDCIISAHAAVPLRWTVETSRVAPAALDAYHGETLHLEATLKSYGTPIAPGDGEASIYWQTNGMGTAYWSAPATCSNNVLSADFTPSMDPGAAVVHGFIGLPGDIYRAAFTLRFRASPGASPNAIELPVRILDFATIEVSNAPWATEQDIELASAALRGEIAAKADAYIFEQADDWVEVGTGDIYRFRQDISAWINETTKARILYHADAYAYNGGWGFALPWDGEYPKPDLFEIVQGDLSATSLTFHNTTETHSFTRSFSTITNRVVYSHEQHTFADEIRADVDRMITLKADKVKTVVTTTILDGETGVETNYYPTVYLDDIAPFTAATNKIEMARRAIENADLSTVSGLSAALEAVKNTLGE